MITALVLMLAMQIPGHGAGNQQQAGQAQQAPGQADPSRPGTGGGAGARPRVPGQGFGPGPGAGQGQRPPPSSTQPAAPAGAPATSAPRPASLAMTSDDGWWLWWEYNKTEFLKPRRRPLSDLVLSLEGDGVVKERLERARTMLLGLAQTSVSDADANVRMAAVLGLGRVGQEAAHADLVKALDDASQQVRHAALLALGASGSEAAQRTLAQIARTGAAAEKGERISPYAKPLAVVALGLGRRAGFDEYATDTALDVYKRREGAERDQLASALFLHHALAHDPRIQTIAVQTAKDEHEAPAVRCRAIEALRGSDEPLVVEALAALSGEGRLDVRRSAALALATCPDIKAFSALLRALEGEKEPLTRGLVLASLARRGEPGVAQLLAEHLRAAQTNQRAWAALALGVHARSHELDDETRALVGKELRRLRADEKDDYTLAALDIAAGLLRDPAQLGAVVEAAGDGRSSDRRAYAMTALSLYGEAPALDALRARVEAESEPVARVDGAVALAVHCRPADAPVLAAMLKQHRYSSMQAEAASALGLHGTTVALDALLAAAMDAKNDRAVRAAALQGLGLILTRPQALAFTDVSRQANYTVLPEWVGPLFMTTL